MQHIPRQTVNAWTEQKKKKLDPRRLIPALVHYHQQGKSTQVWIECIIEAHHTRWSTTTTISPRLTPSPRSVTSVSLSSKRMIRSDEGLTSALDSFHGGQLTSLSQLIKPDYLSTQHHSSFRNLPCLDLWCLFTPLILTDRGGHPLLGVLHRETRKQRPGHSQLFAVVIHWTRRWWVIITIPANARTGLILKGSARKFLTVFLLILHLLRISCSLCHSYELIKFLPHAFYRSPSLWNTNWTLSYSSVLWANTVRFAN